ncbi:homeobox-leucine zipper protein hdg11 [Phtheirospermum japonicum]|uniref:Homeobox-leucine zipper protein hdg11 n=1 Tax=Phtheirospermum japonicum TaxID=374723 RepID=A0A830CNR0_9LAMI|nr:homeobox-leucine zipper protein hdg11 [Phtheirospermum japonicum]
MDFGGAGAGGGSSGGGGGGDHDSHQKKKRYHRHTAYQIQRLEATFKECPHPDDKTRNQLSRELNLRPRQIKFWFQNRRTQMKAQIERADNSGLRAENDKIRCENIAIREALKNVICPSCGALPASEDPYFDEQKLRIENAHLKEELDRVSSMAAKYIGRPISQLPPMQPIHLSSLDLSMSNLDLDLDLVHGNSSFSMIPNLTFPPAAVSDMDKSVMTDIAANAMDELIRLLQSNEPLWVKSADGRDMLDFENYDRIFQSPYGHLKNPNARIEASRDSGVVIMNSLSLVDMFMDSNKWVELFSTIVSRAKTIQVISSGMLGSQSGALQLMYEELQVLSALVPIRQFYFLRFCQQIEEGSWAIVDVSYDIPHQDSHFSPSCKARRLPSGCIIQDMPNGYSKVTWVEHWEIEDKAPIHRLYRDLIHSGLAFGAERWLSALQRICERFAFLMGTANSTRDLGGVIPSPEGKRSIMKLAQRMVSNFCSSMNPSNGQQWTTLSGEFEVRATLHKSMDPGQPNGDVLSASATIWLPLPPENVFNFFRDERTRPQWDVLSNQNPVQELFHIANGSHPGNCISVLRNQGFNTSQNNMLILQESCIDSSGSLVVYCPVDLPSINIAMSGEDPSYIPILPSGFTISPDGPGIIGGSLITVVFQILVSNLPSARMSPESVTTVNNLIGNTVHQIKAALNCNA